MSRIKTEGVHAMAIKMSMGTAIRSQSLDRHDEDDGMRSRQSGEKRNNEAQRRHKGVLRHGDDLMQGSAGEAALR